MHGHSKWAEISPIAERSMFANGVTHWKLSGWGVAADERGSCAQRGAIPTGDLWLALSAGVLNVVGYPYGLCTCQVRAGKKLGVATRGASLGDSTWALTAAVIWLLSCKEVLFSWPLYLGTAPRPAAAAAKNRRRPSQSGKA